MKKQLRILVTTPMCVPSYFNAGHRLPIFQVAGYLRRFGHTVVATDNASLNVTWKDLADLLVQNGFDYIALQNDFDLIEGFGRFVQYVHEFSPETKIVTFGRLSANHPELFHQYAIGGIVSTGDYESGVDQYIQFEEDRIEPDGVEIKFDDEWIPAKPGILLPVSEWILPDIEEINYASIDALYGSDQRKFCGVPDRRELVIPIARGCPVNCNFCEVPKREGLTERRLTVQQVVQYADESFARAPFEYISMYAPTFTLKKLWVRQLCQEFLDKGRTYKWKCTTTMFHLDHELVQLMGRAGCFRISIGLESLEMTGLENLPVQKHDAQRRFTELLSWCNESGIELNCFVIVGLPDTTVEGTRQMFEYLRSLGVRVRPSILSDYSLIREWMTESEAMTILGRHMLPPNTNFTANERLQLYKLVFGVEPHLTQVMNTIPKHSS